MGPNLIPEFAIVGHPNEGKSSVVSTLAEDDSVRISPTPGETMKCQEFPVVIDGREIIRFIDTPGFQNPKQTLQWMREYQGPDERMVQVFREAHMDAPDFQDDVELFGPIQQGAGIIYVVDGSRPVRSVDRAEMEILRLTGRPRMAIINCKDPITGYLEDWKAEFRKHFNAIRVFNAHKATYAERLALLENLKSIDQDWQPALETVIRAFTREWEHRTAVTADIICEMLANCIQYQIHRNFSEKTDEAAIREELQTAYAQAVEKIEQNAHQRIRRLFKHNIFNVDLPPQSILHEDLFNDRTWQFLGLTPKQLVAAAGLAGGAAGAALDVAAGGITFGVFTALGGALGAGWAALGGGKRLARTQVVGMNLGGHQMRMGPNENIQFLYILLDRALIFYSHIINWAHGRRDYPAASPASGAGKAGVTTEWSESAKKTCAAFFRAVRSSDESRRASARKEMKALLQDSLQTISHSERKYGLVIKSAA
jgi:predicted GTPase